VVYRIYPFSKQGKKNPLAREQVKKQPFILYPYVILFERVVFPPGVKNNYFRFLRLLKSCFLDVF